jgi:DMSO/TMAO reductase YedYZ molybdopterin-dependent catalytic subunit
VTLPPGQHRIEHFPRFGTHLHEPPPAVPHEPAIEIAGAVKEPFEVALSDLASLPHRKLTADFHCVAGWSATDLQWEGVPVEAFYREIVEPALEPGATVTHLVFGALDGYWAHMTLEDALAEDVLIADRLDGRPLGPDHGAPARLYSPAHYGFINTKHLCRIEPRTSEPRGYGSASSIANIGLRVLGYGRLPRGRVWHEERSRVLPAWSVRLVGRLLSPGIRAASGRGGRHG